MYCAPTREQCIYRTHSAKFTVGPTRHKGIEMNLSATIISPKRQTVAEEIFQHLRADIIALRLKPNTKLSEVEIAKKFDVSRQPVREAFLRLGEMNMLQIRPQMATRVCRISIPEILNIRFLRIAVEVEVCRRICETATPEDLEAIQLNLDKQKIVIEEGTFDQFQELDYEYHELLCIAAGVGAAFKMILETKSHVDRLCTLALEDIAGMGEIYEDHIQIFNALVAKDSKNAVKIMRFHLERLDETITKAREYHTDYFLD
jgi:DNA-binding GntR family transcriptional regulator